MGHIVKDLRNERRIFLIARSSFDYNKEKRLNEFTVNEKKAIGLSFSDLLQFEFLTPIFPNHSVLYDLHKDIVTYE